MIPFYTRYQGKFEYIHGGEMSEENKTTKINEDTSNYQRMGTLESPVGLFYSI